LGYGTARLRYTTNRYVSVQAHSYVIQTFADLGLLGMAITFGLPGMTDFLQRDSVIAEYEELTGHTVSNLDWFEVYAALRFAIVSIRTGKRGIASTRIAYVHNGLIRVVDSDGENDKAVTRRGFSMSPAWHPSGRRLVYSRMSDVGTQIEQLDLETGNVKSVSATGLNITPVYSNDGRNIVYSHGDESGTDLVMASVAGDGGSEPQRLTFGRGSDNNSPTFSPDGRQIAFISGRSRFPEVYTMDIDGTNVQLLTPFVPGVRTYRTAPDWSPDGRAVAYEQQNGDFQVWMINIRDKEPKRLTSEGENEGPTWAPDGRHLALSSTRGGSKQIWVLDTESGRFRQLTHNAGARLAAWSPMLSFP